MLTLLHVPVKRMLVVVLVVLIGCKDSDKNSSLIFEELNESLERSNNAIENSTQNLLNELEDRKRNGATAERAIFWYAKADSIKSRTDEVIESMKKNQLNMIMKNVYENKKYDLHDTLEKYREYILSFDSTMKLRLAKAIPTFNGGIKYKNQLGENTLQVKTVLLKLENDVRVAENMVIVYCNQQTAPGCNLLYSRIGTIATSNSNKFGVGEEMVISLGIGEFSLSNKPSFFVNNKNVIPNGNGIGEYKMNVGNKPGEYKTRVKIMYTTPDGKRDSLEKDIKYTVVE